MRAERAIGRIGRRWTKAVAVLGAAIVAAAAIGVETARADDLVPTLEVAVEVNSDVSTEVQTAVDVASSAVAQVEQAATEPTASTMAVAPSPTSVDPAAVAASIGGDAPSTVMPAPATPMVERARLKLEHPRKSRPRARPQARGRPPARGAVVVSARRPFLAAARAVPHTASGTRTTAGRARHAAPPRPAPLSPKPPGRDDPGISWGGQGGGEGAFPGVFAAALAALLTLAISLVLRQVIWWAQPMPRRIALPPWRPG